MLIPSDLSQDGLPYSMRFYDPIIAIVQENVVDAVRDMVNLKNQVAFEKYNSHQVITHILDFIGANPDNQKEKLQQ